MSMRLCLICLLFWASPVWALNLANESLQASIYCAQDKNCEPKKSEFFEKLLLACELETKSLKCAELVQENPSLQNKLRRCDQKSLCDDSRHYTLEKNKACLRGYKNALVDMAVDIKDMAFSLAGIVESSYEGIKTDQKQKREFVAQCETSLNCKKDLVKDDPRYNNLSDVQLENYTAAFLYVESRDYKAYRSSLDRQRVKPYAPLSERAQDETDLSASQLQKRADILQILKSKIQKSYAQYSCYNPVAQAELECYVLGSVVDPTLIAGYFVKSARGVMAARRLEKGVTEVRKSDAALTSASAADLRKSSRAEFTNKYVTYSPTTPEQNAKWIAVAEKGANPRTRFLDVENSQMKQLNDSIKDKNLVTSLTNYHKDILFKHIAELEQEFPGLHVEKYSDFKSSRFAFSGNVPADIETRMAAIFAQTNGEFSDYLMKNHIVRESDKTETWFRAGWGQSADQANLAARYSRAQEANNLQNYANTSLQQSMSAKLASIETQRQGLQTELARTSVVRNGTLDADAFDIVRKGGGDTQKIKTELKNRYGLSELPDKTVEKIKDYSKEVDDFSPGIYIEKREFANMDEAVHGGLSADMIGLGSANLRGTAEALARSPTLERALSEARLAEKAVTVDFKEQKKVFEDTLKKTLPGKVKTVCSGDDCVAVATSQLSRAEKNKVMSELAKTPYAGKYRLAFVAEGVESPTARTMLTTHGESIEKNLRKELSGVIEPRKLKGLTFAADMQTTELYKGRVDLIIGSAPGVNLTKQERKMIEERFNASLQELNNSLKKSGTPSTYTPAQLGW